MTEIFSTMFADFPIFAKLPWFAWSYTALFCGGVAVMVTSLVTKD
jgi:hypothetical protein